MEQWDTLHAMLVYEILELREAYEGFPDCSRPKPRGKCLQLPFVLKVRGPISHFDSLKRPILSSPPDRPTDDTMLCQIISRNSQP